MIVGGKGFVYKCPLCDTVITAAGLKELYMKIVAHYKSKHPTIAPPTYEEVQSWYVGE